MNDWLLVEMLRRKWGFEGVLVTDYDNVGAPGQGPAGLRRLRRGGGPRRSRAGTISSWPRRSSSKAAWRGCGRSLLAQDGAGLDPPAGARPQHSRMGLFKDAGRSDLDPDSQGRSLRGARFKSIFGPRADPSFSSRTTRIDGSPFLPLDPSRPRRMRCLAPTPISPSSGLATGA